MAKSKWLVKIEDINVGADSASVKKLPADDTSFFPSYDKDGFVYRVKVEANTEYQAKQEAVEFVVGEVYAKSVGAVDDNRASDL
jgi:hypothetical protein